MHDVVTPIPIGEEGADEKDTKGIHNDQRRYTSDIVLPVSRAPLEQHARQHSHSLVAETALAEDVGPRGADALSCIGHRRRLQIGPTQGYPADSEQKIAHFFYKFCRKKRRCGAQAQAREERRTFRGDATALFRIRKSHAIPRCYTKMRKIARNYSFASIHRSASRAAMQPVPAAVTA